MSLLMYIDNDNLLTVAGVQQVTDGSFINDAVVTAALRDAAGDHVAGQTFPITLEYVVASDGVYRGGLEDTLDAKAQVQYTLFIGIDDGSGIRANFQIPVKAILRGAC